MVVQAPKLTCLSFLFPQKMKFNSHLCFFFLFSVSFLLCSSYALNFQVGGSKGWVLQPNEDYNHWAERLRFQINDSLYFKYKKGSDSVLVVNKDDYLSCNTKNPILEMNDGYSSFKFDHSGPFYFISGNENNCKKGQKLIVVVMADRSSKYPKPPSHPAIPPATPTKPHLGPKASPPKSQLGPSASPPKHQFGPSAPPPKSHLGPSAPPQKSHLGPSAQPPKSQYGPSAPPTGAQGPSSSVPAMPPKQESPVPSGSPYKSPISPPSTSPSPSSELPQPPSPSSAELSPSPSSIAPGPGEDSTETPASSPPAANSPGTAGSGGEANLKAPAPATVDNKKSAANTLVGLSVTLVLSLVLGSFVVGV